VTNITSHLPLTSISWDAMMPLLLHAAIYLELPVKLIRSRNGQRRWRFFLNVCINDKHLPAVSLLWECCRDCSTWYNH